ncbi:hypothetical protein LWI28_003292 [Acer negundo]|uniref:MATH domain-containing protein n=1 Tax=Acer negundo TaxID=4023 RepID=A0AAD5JD44_ACENE|nr:hypothetical protein LWI28_003292 [Acer negundo]
MWMKESDPSNPSTYKINGEKAVHLNPRHRLKDAKPSTKSNTGATCLACGRYLQDSPNLFCSIACKVSVVPMKPKDQQTLMTNLPVDISSASDKKSILSFTDFSDVISTHLMMMSPGLKPINNAFGRTRFVSLAKLNDPKLGFLVDDTLIIEAEVTLLGMVLAKSSICL